MDNGVILHVCPHDTYIHFSMSGIELPTTVNGDPEWKSNNCLAWEYREANYDR